MKNATEVILSINAIEDLLSACTFTRAEYERVRKDKAPNFKKALERIEKRLWAALRKARKASEERVTQAQNGRGDGST